MRANITKKIINKAGRSGPLLSYILLYVTSCYISCYTLHLVIYLVICYILLYIGFNDILTNGSVTGQGARLGEEKDELSNHSLNVSPFVE